MLSVNNESEVSIAGVLRSFGGVSPTFTQQVDDNAVAGAKDASDCAVFDMFAANGVWEVK